MAGGGGHIHSIQKGGVSKIIVINNFSGSENYQFLTKAELDLQIAEKLGTCKIFQKYEPPPKGAKKWT